MTVDKVTCADEDFAAPPPGCRGPRQECTVVETQQCATVEEEACAELVQAECTEEAREECRTEVEVGKRTECLLVSDVSCQDHNYQLCFQGYEAKDCEVTPEQECKYVSVGCTPGTSGYACQPKKEKVCNYVSKTKCKSHYGSPQCKSISSQKCKVTPRNGCFSLPEVKTRQVCQTRIVNSCKEAPTRECLKTFKTECKPLKQEICRDISPSGCSMKRMTNQMCEVTKKDVCFNAQEVSVCTKSPRSQCFTIPTTSCDKVPARKCFQVPLPPPTPIPVVHTVHNNHQHAPAGPLSHPFAAPLPHPHAAPLPHPLAAPLPHPLAAPLPVPQPLAPQFEPQLHHTHLGGRSHPVHSPPYFSRFSRELEQNSDSRELKQNSDSMEVKHTSDSREMEQTSA